MILNHRDIFPHRQCAPLKLPFLGGKSHQVDERLISYGVQFGVGGDVRVWRTIEIRDRIGPYLHA